MRIHNMKLFLGIAIIITVAGFSPAYALSTPSKFTESCKKYKNEALARCLAAVSSFNIQMSKRQRQMELDAARSFMGGLFRDSDFSGVEGLKQYGADLNSCLSYTSFICKYKDNLGVLGKTIFDYNLCVRRAKGSNQSRVVNLGGKYINMAPENRGAMLSEYLSSTPISSSATALSSCLNSSPSECSPRKAAECLLGLL